MNRSDYSGLALSESGFLFDTESGAAFTLNNTGKFILRRLMDGDDSAAIAEGLAGLYDVTGEEAMHDLDQFVTLLRKMDLIPADGADR